jgi:hypothetical protein
MLLAGTYLLQSDAPPPRSLPPAVATAADTEPAQATTPRTFRNGISSSYADGILLQLRDKLGRAGELPAVVAAVLRRLEFVSPQHPQWPVLRSGLANISSGLHAGSYGAGKDAQALLLVHFETLHEQLMAEPPTGTCQLKVTEGLSRTADPCELSVAALDGMIERSENNTCGAHRATSRCRVGVSPAVRMALRNNFKTKRSRFWTPAEQRFMRTTAGVFSQSRWAPLDGGNASCPPCDDVARLANLFALNTTVDVRCWSPLPSRPGVVPHNATDACTDDVVAVLRAASPVPWIFEAPIHYAARAASPSSDAEEVRKAKSVVIDAITSGMFPSSHLRSRDLAINHEEHLFAPMGVRQRHYLMTDGIRRPKKGSHGRGESTANLRGADLRRRAVALQRVIPGRIDSWFVFTSNITMAFGTTVWATPTFTRLLYMALADGGLLGDRPDYTLWIRPDVWYPLRIDVAPRGTVPWMTMMHGNDTHQVPIDGTLFGGSLNVPNRKLLGDLTFLAPMSRAGMQALRLFPAFVSSCFRHVHGIPEMTWRWVFEVVRLNTRVFRFGEQIDRRYMVDSLDDLCDRSLSL